MANESSSGKSETSSSERDRGESYRCPLCPADAPAFQLAGTTHEHSAGIPG